MSNIHQMSPSELAAYIQDRLRAHDIQVVLSGGSAVAFYSANQYVSKDINLINARFAKRKEIKSAMAGIGFQEHGRYFIHPESDQLIEFPDGPLSVGEEPVKEISEFTLSTGILRIISPTDCVKDRLCAFYFWGDRQALAQAILVAESQTIDLAEIERWSNVERKAQEFQVFKKMLSLPRP